MKWFPVTAQLRPQEQNPGIPYFFLIWTLLPNYGQSISVSLSSRVTLTSRIWVIIFLPGCRVPLHKLWLRHSQILHILRHCQHFLHLSVNTCFIISANTLLLCWLTCNDVIAGFCFYIPCTTTWPTVWTTGGPWQCCCTCCSCSWPRCLWWTTWVSSWPSPPLSSSSATSR